MRGVRLRLLVALALGAAAVPAPVTAQEVAAPAVSAEHAMVQLELQSALFELASERPVAAAHRLEWLRGTEAWRTGARPSDDAELRFLLATVYYRLGASSRFRALAEPLLDRSSAERAAVLRALLAFDAYQRGDAGFGAAAAEQSHDPFLHLLAGLAQAELGHTEAAGRHFDLAAAAGGELARIARYMHALMIVSAEPARTAEAIEVLQAVATVDDELTRAALVAAARLAYAVRRYDVAMELATRAMGAGDASPEAARVHAWSLYHRGEFERAAVAFAALAERHGSTPEGSEARTMAAQALLDAGRASAAAEQFSRSANALGVQATGVTLFDGPRTAAAARTLVASRETSFLFTDIGTRPAGLELSRESAIDHALAIPVVASQARRERWLAELLPRLGADFPVAVMREQPSGRVSRSEHTAATVVLRDTDVDGARALFAVRDARLRRGVAVEQMAALARLVETEGEGLSLLQRQLQRTQDSLVNVLASMDAARERVRRLIREQSEAARTLAAENQRLADTLRARLGTWIRPAEEEILAAERTTATEFGRLADLVAGGLDGAIARHPVFAQYDSVTSHAHRNRLLITEARAQLAVTGRVAREEGERRQGTESREEVEARRLLVAAEQRRAAAEARVVALVEAELLARAARSQATLRRQIEIAEFGAASALFFSAIQGEGSRSANATPTVAADAGKTEP